MSESAEEGVLRSGGGARPWWMLSALALGLAAGSAAAFVDEGIREAALGAASVVGGLWLNALTMTVIPLIVALLVVGVAEGAEAARAGRIAGRAMAWFVGIYLFSAIFGALAINALLATFPLPPSAAEAVRTGLATLDYATRVPPTPPVSEFFSGIIPSNAISAAANGDVLQLVLFIFLFALAISRIAAPARTALLGFFEAIRDALLVLIGWVLLVAPIGVFALAFALASGAGGAAVAALLHYVVLLCIVGAFIGVTGYVLAVLVGRRSLAHFAKAVLLPQSVALSTRSSLASIPAMLVAARRLGVRERVADVTFPMIGALLRPTSPAMNLSVVFYIAYVLGLDPSMAQIFAAILVASIVAFGTVSIPGEVSFIMTIAPIAIALGVPVAPLALLVAVEMIPDIIRTTSNVTVDVAVTTAIDRSVDGPPEGGPTLAGQERPAIARTRSE